MDETTEKPATPEPLTLNQELTEDKIKAIMSMIRDISVSDGYSLASRYFGACVRFITESDDSVIKHYHDGQPPTWLAPNMLQGFNYLEMYCKGASETFLEEKSGKCVLEGAANVVDLLRGFRILALRHPIAEAKDLYSKLGHGIGLAVKARVGFPFDVAPGFNTAEEVRGTLLIWHTLMHQASQIMGEILRSKGAQHTKGGLHIVGKQGEARVQLIRDFSHQSFSELRLFIDAIGAEF